MANNHKINIHAEIYELAEKKKKILFSNSYSSSREKDRDLSELECFTRILATKVFMLTGLDYMEALRKAIDFEVNKEILKRKDIASHMKKMVLLDDAEVCSVCLQDMDGAVGDAVVLKCLHTFHEKCILGWLRRKPDCPLCRHDMCKDRQQKPKRKRVSHGDEETKGETSFPQRQKIYEQRM